MANDTREITLNARRARFIADHWEDEQLAPGFPVSMSLGFAIAGEIGAMDAMIQGYWKKSHPEMARELEELHQQMTTKEFWEHLTRHMEGTRFAACGLTFKEFSYRSHLKPLWSLEVYESPPSGGMSSGLPRQKRKWGCHPIGCLGKVGKLLLKLVLPVWLVLYAIHLWSPPAGDAPKPEPAKPKPVVAEKKAEAQPNAVAAEQPAGTLAVGTRVVAKKAIPIYRLNEEKKPVVAGRVPAGTVLEVTGTVNAKVVRVSVELPNGKKGKGMTRVADLEE